jgi:hypothetical protein
MAVAFPRIRLHIVNRAALVLSRIAPGDSRRFDEFVFPEGDKTRANKQIRRAGHRTRIRCTQPSVFHQHDQCHPYWTVISGLSVPSYIHSARPAVGRAPGEEHLVECQPLRVKRSTPGPATESNLEYPSISFTTCTSYTTSCVCSNCSL